MGLNHKNGQELSASGAANSGSESKEPPKKRRKKRFEQIVYYDWCKACGLCVAFCPQQIFGTDKLGRPYVEKPDDCIGCKFCELHCPDFAITIKERSPRRRKEDTWPRRRR